MACSALHDSLPLRSRPAPAWPCSAWSSCTGRRLGPAAWRGHETERTPLSYERRPLGHEGEDLWATRGDLWATRGDLWAMRERTSDLWATGLFDYILFKLFFIHHYSIKHMAVFSVLLTRFKGSPLLACSWGRSLWVCIGCLWPKGLKRSSKVDW